MPLHKTGAFILRTYPLAESHKICVLLTRNSGLIRGIAHGARRIKSRFGASLELFTEVQLTYYEKEGRELVNLSSCDIIRSHFWQVSKTENATALSYIAELLCEFMPAHEANERLYRLILAILEAIEQEAHVDSLLRYFEVWLLKLSGYFPELNECTDCHEVLEMTRGIWLEVDGTPQCYQCSGGRGTPVSPELRRTLAAIMRSSPQAFAVAEKPIEHLNALAEICYRLIRRVVERELRSYSPMTQVQAELRRS